MYNKISFTPSGASEAKDTFIEEGTTLEEYLLDVEMLDSLKNIDIRVNGATANLEAELENGDSVTLQPRKTDSGQKKA